MPIAITGTSQRINGPQAATPRAGTAKAAGNVGQQLIAGAGNAAFGQSLQANLGLYNAKGVLTAQAAAGVGKAASLDTLRSPTGAGKAEAARAAAEARQAAAKETADRKAAAALAAAEKRAFAAAEAAAQKAAPKLSGGSVVAGTGDVIVDIKASDSGYDNRLFYSTDGFKTRTYIGADNQTGSINLGRFKAGTKIEFGIDNGQGDFFRTGSARSNTDNFQHARTESVRGGVRIGFEDLRGGGDQDFNDAIIEVRSNVAFPLPGAPAAGGSPASGNGAQTPAAGTGDNRSGLGDGTNPGQGAGRVNSPNTGTDNPNSASREV